MANEALEALALQVPGPPAGAPPFVAALLIQTSTPPIFSRASAVSSSTSFARLQSAARPYTRSEECWALSCATASFTLPAALDDSRTESPSAVGSGFTITCTEFSCHSEVFSMQDTRKTAVKECVQTYF